MNGLQLSRLTEKYFFADNRRKHAISYIDQLFNSHVPITVKVNGQEIKVQSLDDAMKTNKLLGDKVKAALKSLFKIQHCKIDLLSGVNQSQLTVEQKIKTSRGSRSPKRGKISFTSKMLSTTSRIKDAIKEQQTTIG